MPYPYGDMWEGRRSLRYNPDVHHRQSLRLKSHDYQTSGWYFVTVCTYQRELSLGEIVNGQMLLSPVGEIVRHEWQQITVRFPTLVLEQYMPMPNHFHALLCLPSQPDEPLLLGNVMGAFKSLSARAANDYLGRSYRPFWQRNYHEQIVRDDHHLENIRAYILANPSNWQNDAENPLTNNPP